MNCLISNTPTSFAQNGNCPPQYAASSLQPIEQIEQSLNRLSCSPCTGRYFPKDFVSVPGFPGARTDLEREAMQNIHQALKVNCQVNGFGRVRDLYVVASRCLHALDRRSYELGEYIILQELKVSCQSFIASNSGPIGKIVLHSYQMELANLYKERGKYKDAVAPLYLLRSAEVRIEAAKNFYDKDAAARCLEETIYDLTVMPNASSAWVQHSDEKNRLLQQARDKYVALQNPSFVQQIGNFFQKTYGWVIEQV